jgi:hypothetical protein
MENFKEYVDHLMKRFWLLDNSRRVIRSPEFHFLIGHDQRKLTIHAGLVRNLSAPLDALMNGSMKEAVCRTATIDDVEEDTFIAFREFAYRGEYNTPYRDNEDNGSHFGAERKYCSTCHGKYELCPI